MWEVKPLEGKYYETFIENKRTGEFVKVPSFLIDMHYIASDREKADGWEPTWGYDHTETQRTYEIAQVIARALNSYDGIPEQRGTKPWPP